MTSSLIDHPNDTSVRAWLRRKRRVVILAAAGLLATGVFLLWGPVGLGNGPLSAAVGYESGTVHAGGPVGFVIPLYNSGGSPVVVDGLDLIGGTSYPGPHVLGLEILTAGACLGPWPARQAGRGFVLVGCGGADAGPLAGRAVGPTHPVGPGFPAAAEVAAPRQPCAFGSVRVSVPPLAADSEVTPRSGSASNERVQGQCCNAPGARLKAARDRCRVQGPDSAHPATSGGCCGGQTTRRPTVQAHQRVGLPGGKHQGSPG